MQLLVDQVLIDRFRTFRAPDRIDDQVVLHFLDPDEVGYDVLYDAKLFLGAHATR